MNLFSDLKIKYKLIGLTLIITIFSLVICLSFFVLIGVNTLQNELVNNTRTIAQVYSNGAVSSIAFSDTSRANDLLSKLDALSTINMACIYDTSGRVFASYRSSSYSEKQFPKLQFESSSFDKGSLNLYHVINFNGEYFGTLYLNASTLDLSSKVRNLIYNLIIVIIVVILFSLVLTIKLQSYISKPILNLASVTNQIGSEGDYSVRVNKTSNDEIGVLYDYFNKMLDQIRNRDIERDRVETELNEAKMFLTNVINSMPSILISVDANGVITQWNKSAVETLQISSSVAIGQLFWEIVPTIEKFKFYFKEVIETNKPKIFTREKLFNLENKLFNLSLFPLIKEDYSGMVIRIDDITEIDKKEHQLQQSQKMDSIGVLAGGLAHDFNNALGGIIGTLSLIEHKFKSSDVIKKDQFENYINTINQASRRASNIVSHLLALSRKQEILFESQNLNFILKQVINICKNTFDRSIEIKTNFYPEDATVFADYTLLEQVFLNLCINGAHAMTIMKDENERQGGVLEISIDKVFADERFLKEHHSAENIHYWKISIADNGVGMSNHIITNIFDPFFTTKSKGTGTGLGLTMCYSIIQQHKGLINVYSELGRGSMFSVYLPVLLDDQLKDAGEFDADIPMGEGLILVVDDEEMMREIAGDILNECGYKTIFAVDGENAIEVYRENYNEIAVVLLDMIMPKKSGKEAFLEIKKINPNVKVLLTSGFRKDERVESVLNMGAQGYVPKPYGLESLAKEIFKVIYNL